VPELILRRHRKNHLRRRAVVKARIQLTLYVPPSSAVSIEECRRLLDPIQANLIPAHVTLCREDEVQDVDLSALGSILRASRTQPITLKFGSPEVFQGHGLLLPCVEGEDQFQDLRRCVLGSRNVRHHTPHITVAHPRNPRSPQNVPANLSAIPKGLIITFATVRHIRQEAMAPWQVIGEQSLLGTARSDA